jgi:hypothetical protein
MRSRALSDKFHNFRLPHNPSKVMMVPKPSDKGAGCSRRLVASPPIRAKGLVMGQVAVLPDPLDDSTASVASADDLLSQLAGEEIDRLLAESHTETEAAPLADDVPDVPLRAARRAPEDPVLPDLPALARDATQEVVQKSDEQAVPDSVGAGEEVTPARVIAPLPAEAPAAVSDSPAASGAEPNIPPSGAADLVITEPAIAAAERAALGEPPLTESSSPSDDNSRDSLPLYLKPLEWLNAPLMAAPLTVREIIGKVAIVTLVNALAVLLYVLMFRRH